jgi:spore maturation protein CgeB
MKIILVAPKSISSHRASSNEAFRFDYAFWNFYLPLCSLGHEVTFFDTSKYGDTQLKEIIEIYKPDLLFCIMTGAPHFCPQEPWDAIKDETDSGRTKTFNWFCDDAWRFNDFSSKFCWYFNCVVTTDDILDVDKYKKIGYNNAIYATWHANADVYSGLNSIKDSDVAFVGNLTGNRKEVFDLLKNRNLNVNHFSKVSFEDMVWNYSKSKIGLNLSKNSNDKDGKLILKARPFEITGVGSMLLTQDAVGLSDCFKNETEIVVFNEIDELVSKCNFLTRNPKIAEKIARNGHKRFLKDHESRIRLSQLLEKIKRI